MTRPRVLLADDHVVVLEGLTGLLAPDFDVVGTVQDGRALLAAAEKLKPDAVVADISMPLLNGIEAARHLRKYCPQTKIVFLTMHPDAGLLREALRAGGLGYVLKTSAVSELKAAILEALRGRHHVPPAIAEVLGVPLHVFLSGRTRRSEELTARQREVLQLLAEGRTVKEIANVLSISPRTAEFHKYRIMRALGARTVAELTQYAMRRHLAAGS